MPKPVWTCALCHYGKPDVVRSKKKRDLCDLCYDGLEARGLAWCPKGKHRVSIGAIASCGRACLPCLAVYARERYRRNPEPSRQYHRKMYETDPTIHRTRSARYHAAHLEQERARARLYRAENKEALAQRRKARYWANPEAERARAREKNAQNKRNWRIRRKLRILQSWRRAA